jgi:hypothetical protein
VNAATNQEEHYSLHETKHQKTSAFKTNTFALLGTPSLNFFAEVLATSASIDKLPETTFLNSRGYTKKTIFDRTASVQSTQTLYFPIEAVISLLCRIRLKFHSKTCWSKFMNEEAGKP